MKDLDKKVFAVGMTNVMAFELQCPCCGQGTLIKLDRVEPGAEIHCDHCGRKMRQPLKEAKMILERERYYKHCNIYSWFPGK